MACRSQTSWGRVSLSWKWFSGETPLGILEMSHLHYMFGKQHELDGIDYVSKTCVDMECERSWDGKPRDCQLREGSPHSSLTKEYYLGKWISLL